MARAGAAARDTIATMYKDDLEAAQARISSLEADLEAEQQKRQAAEAETRAAQARLNELELKLRRAGDAGSGASPSTGRKRNAKVTASLIAAASAVAGCLMAGILMTANAPKKVISQPAVSTPPAIPRPVPLPAKKAEQAQERGRITAQEVGLHQRRHRARLKGCAMRRP